MSPTDEVLLRQISIVMEDRQSKAAVIGEQFLVSLDQLEHSPLPYVDFFQRKKAIIEAYWDSVNLIDSAYLQQLLVLQEDARHHGILRRQWTALFRQVKARPAP